MVRCRPELSSGLLSSRSCRTSHLLATERRLSVSEVVVVDGPYATPCSIASVSIKVRGARTMDRDITHRVRDDELVTILWSPYYHVIKVDPNRVAEVASGHAVIWR